MPEFTDFSQGWRLFPLDLDQGLLGPVGRAYQRNFRPPDAVSVTLPITAPAAWLEAGRIADPYFGLHHRDLLWMEQKEWWYLKDFDLPRQGGRYRLVFEGANYRAEVWLNDVQIGLWEGSFLRREIDLDPELLLEQGNRLAVRVRAQERAWEDGTQENPRGFQNSSAHLRTQRPSPQFAYGWNWAPHLIAIGLWRPVRLFWQHAVRWRETRIHAELSGDFRQATICFSGTIEKLQESLPGLEVFLRVTRPDGRCAEVRVPVAPGAGGEPGTVEVSLTLAQPALWYPNGYGPQPLHEVEVCLLAGGECCDVRRRRLGLRRIEFVQNTHAESVLRESGQTNRRWSIVGQPYPWTLLVNGRRTFSKGTNWCPVDSLLRPREAHVRRLLELCRDAHYVFLRVWGGGLTESDHFYDVCEELGLLVMQEFWLACGSAPAMDLRVFLENAASEILRLRERTALAVWCGGNEFNPDNPENRPIVDRLQRLVGELDGTREFRRGSPYKGDRHGGLVSLPNRITNKYRDLLPGRQRLVLLRSECAVGRSPARSASIRRFISPEALWPIDWKQYQNHHAQRPEWETVTRPFGLSASWEQELLHASVFHCLDSRMNMEFMRAHKYETSGCWTWQLNGSWPSFHREHIDWFGCPKPVYYWYKNACRPVLCLADLERFVWHPGEIFNPVLFLVNDTAQAVRAEVSIRLISVDGETLYRETRMAGADPDASFRMGPLAVAIPQELAEGVFYLALQTRLEGRLVHANTYYLAVSPDCQVASSVPLGGRLRVSYLGAEKEVCAPHYYTSSEIVDEPTELDKIRQSASAEAFRAVYRTEFAVPPHLAGKPLEICLPGPSADDRVVLNGQTIGAGWIDPDTEKNYEADPLRWPTLPTRFYAIPDSLLRAEDNQLEIHLDGNRLVEFTDKRFGLTEMVCLREATDPALQEKIRTYQREMGFFRKVVEGPPARVEIALEGRAENWQIRIRNTGRIPAIFLVLDLEGEGDVRFTFADGACSGLHPGDEWETSLRCEGAWPDGAQVVLRGLNVAATVVEPC